MKLAVIGSRTFTNYKQMEICLASKPSIAKIITGDTCGADQLACKYAETYNIPVEIYPGNKEAIVEQCDAIIAFWDGKSPGTQEVLRHAKKMKKHLEVIFLEQREYEAPFGYISLPSSS